MSRTLAATTVVAVQKAGGAGDPPMQLRTFRGRTMAEALTAVKRELGADALIVHTRSYKVGGMLGVGAKEEIEILASAPPVNPRLPVAGAPPASRGAVAGRLSAAYAPPAVRPEAQTAPKLRSAPTTREPVQPEVMQVRRRVLAAPAGPRRPAHTPSGAVAASPEDAARPIAKLAASGAPAAIQDELGAIRQMVSQLLASGAAPASRASEPASGPGGGDPLAEWYVRLLSAAVSREIAERIIGEARRGIGRGADAGAVRRLILEQIVRQLPVAGEPLVLAAGSQSRTRAVAIVGATGVGKTTTIAKLAAQVKLTRGARVGVITADTNRIGAIEQLRTYADVIGVPFAVAASPDEMSDARGRCAGMDLVLVDTPGLSPRDERGIAALADLMARADLDEVHLALPASASEASLMAAWRAFAPLKPTRLLFTKLDEAVTYGVVLSVASQVGAGLSYITSGPRIPEEIEVADAGRLAELIAA